jgi:hypothetical protein
VELVGLQLLSMNRYQDCNNTWVCSCWDQWSTCGPEMLKTHLSASLRQVNCAVWQVKFKVTSVICQMDVRGLGCTRISEIFSSWWMQNKGDLNTFFIYILAIEFGGWGRGGRWGQIYVSVYKSRGNFSSAGCLASKH